MNGKTTVDNGGVILPITRVGKGQPVVFFNGGGATQISWKNIIGRLKGDYETVTFDFRGHGKASSADDYSLKAFLGDAQTVMNALGLREPVIVGWSLGADLAVAYTASHPGEVGGLVLVDGAVPLAKPLVENEADLRRSLNSPVMKFSRALIRLTPYNYRISGDAYADITVALDNYRQTSLLDDYRSIDCPITMVMATKSAGTNGARAERNNKLWSEGIKRLTAEYPSITARWIDGTHALPFKHPDEIANAIDDVARHVGALA